jgi:flagellar hook-associated protein 2
MGGISSPGIGSNLPINDIIAKLMQAESQPLMALAKKEASYQAKLSAFGALSGSLGTFQAALAKLNTASTFQAVSAMAGDSSVLGASATSQASPGSYSVNVTRLAQAQTLFSAGVASTTATIGAGTSTKLTFQFGTISGNIVNAGTKLNASVASTGIAANSLSINGTTIATGSSTNSAKALAAQINLVSATTGVSASAQATDTGALGAFTTTSGAATYKLDVEGINIFNEAALGTTGTTAADIDAAVTATANSLTASGISFSGTAAAGTLKFTRADGSNIAVAESGAGAAGGLAAIGIGTTKAFTSSVSLSSANAITVAGGDPAAAGFTAGTFSTYGGATFAQDPNQSSAEVTIDNTNNSLQGIRDALNKANIGVTATIVSDGSVLPQHLVITSNKTGATSSMKIDVQGDATLANLLAYDPAGTQKMTQTSAAQSAALTVNGIAVTSPTNSVSGAIEGVSLTLSKLGSSSLTVKRDTAGVQSSVNGFVKAYNDLNSTIKKLTAYNSETKQAGLLIGDSSVRNIEAQIRKMIGSPTTGSNSSLKTLSQVGISIAKDGTMSVDSGKLSTAMNNNLEDVAALFSSIGKTTDSLVRFDSASSVSTPGTHDVFIKKLATQGKVVGSTVVAPTTIDATNKDLSLTIDGVTASVSLVPRGTAYTPAELAAQVQSAINGASALTSAGIAVSVTIDAGGKMNITSNKYGSTSKVSVSGTAANAFLGTPVATDGIDVEGTIGGVTAGGSGRFLTGASGSPAAGIKLEVTGGAENASRGSINFSQGYAFHLNNLMDTFLGSKGLIGGRTDGLNSSIKDVGKMTERVNGRLADMEKRYRAQFTALDVAISGMNSTSNFLTQQLAQFSKM